jgi:hypothetical protein
MAGRSTKAKVTYAGDARMEFCSEFTKLDNGKDAARDPCLQIQWYRLGPSENVSRACRTEGGEVVVTPEEGLIVCNLTPLMTDVGYVETP